MLRSVIRLFSWDAREGFKRLPVANVRKTGDRWKKREKYGKKDEKEQKYGERERERERESFRARVLAAN